MNKTEKPIFKKGDRVYHNMYGWGCITGTNVNGHPKIYYVDFYKGDELELREYELSFTEYTLKGFSQERPIDWKDYIGEWGFFWSHKLDNKTLGVLEQHSFDAWDFFKARGETVIYTEYQPLTPDLKKLLTREGVIKHDTDK